MKPASERATRMALPIPDIAERSELVAAVTFLECAAAEGMDRAELVTWLDRNLVETGRMLRPTSVYEPGVGVALLRSRLHGPCQQLAEVIHAARERTLAALGGLVEASPRDGFVLAALYATRVRRSAEASGWLACPHPTDALSDIVLSLFTVDVLRFRESYEARLRVCVSCGRVALDATPSSSRTGCVIHPFA